MKISACLIVRDDPHLPRAVESIRPHVDEVVIVSEIDDPRIRALADRFELCTDYLGSEELLKGRYPWLLGRLVHFGAMRQRAFDIASGDYLLWLDSDDVVSGGEHLRHAVSMLAELESPRLLCKYEYAFDAHGRPTYVQWRERVVRNDGSCKWQHRGHENIVAVKGDSNDVYDYRAIWQHRRTDYQNKPGLNLALVRLEAEENGYDGWAAFNLGSECFLAAGTIRNEDDRKAMVREAIEHLEKYWDLSGWDDQRCFAAVRLVNAYIGLDPMGAESDTYAKAQAWAEKARELRPSWVEPHVALANMAMLRSCKLRGDDVRAEMRLILSHCDAAMAGETRTPIGTKLHQQDDIFGLLQAAHETLQEWPAALECVRKLRAHDSEDPTLKLCERTYEERAHGIDALYPGGLDIVIAAPGFSSEPWDPDVLDAHGLGGSETAVIEMAKRLAEKGHRVRVYGNPTRPGLWDGVQYYQYSNRFGTACDVLIAWRLAPLVDWCDAKVRLLWVHDALAHSMTSKFALQADAILALSEWHRGNLVKNHKVHTNHVRVTRNGIDLARFDKTVRRNAHRAIYSSSPDRGLAVLLDLWPRIRAQVPDAELEIFYGFDGWRKSLEIKDDIHHRYVIAHIEETAANLPGVTLRGKVNQDELAEAMLGAGVWCSPTYFTETNCISVQEATAAGLRIVTSAIAALKETVADRGVLIEGNWLSADYQRQFVQHVVEAMTWEHWGAFSRQELREYARAHFSWDGVADEWDAMMREMLDGASFGALPPYCPVTVAAA